MSRALGWLALLVGSLSWAQGASLAVRPLDAVELDREQRVALQNVFAVAIARVTSVRVAGSERTDLARARARDGGCGSPEACLRQLAVETESLYAVSAHLRPNALGTELLASATVVRSDGETVRVVSLNSPLLADRGLLPCATELLGVLVKTLELGKLPPTASLVETPVVPQVSQDAEALGPRAGLSARRVVGITTLTLGVGAAAVGGVLLGFSASEQNRQPATEALHAASIRNRQRATVLLPVGAVLAVVGALLVVWPEHHGVQVSLAASPEGGGLLVSGRLP